MKGECEKCQIETRDSQQEAGSFVDTIRSQFNDTITDISVPGGMITVKRLFYDDAWHWAPLDSHLQFKVKKNVLEAILKEEVAYRVKLYF